MVLSTSIMIITLVNNVLLKL